MRGGLSLQERLMVLVASAILPLSALSVWFAVREMASASQQARSQLQVAASFLAAEQDRTVEAARQLLSTISLTPQMRPSERKACAKYFEVLVARYPVYTNIGLLDTRGKVICQANSHIGDFGISASPDFTTVLDEHRFAMGAPVRDGIPQRSIIPLTQPLFDGDKLAAVAFAGLDLANAGTALDAALLPKSAQVAILDRRGAVLMAYPPPVQGASAALQPAGPLLAAARGMVSGMDEWSDASGVPRIYAYAPSRRTGEGFLAVVSVGRDRMTQAPLAALRRELTVLAAVLLAGLAAAWWVGARVVVKPARQILGILRQLKLCHLDVRVPLHGGSRRNEFARIGAAFNLMAESLQVRQSELKTELGRSKGAYAVLDLVLNSMHDGLVAVSSAGQLLMFNEAAARLLPLAGPPSLPQHWPERFGIYRPDGSTLFPADELPLMHSARGESRLRQQLFIRNDLVPEGRLVQCTWQPIHGDNGISGGLAVFTDVTELQRLQDEQAAQQRKLVEAQRLGRIGNWEMDLRSGRLWWSDEVYGLFGIARENFDGTLNAFMQCVHPDDRALLKPARDSALRDGKVMNVEYRVVKPDGIAWIHEIAQARRNDQDEPVWFGGVMQDTTLRKNGEQALLESQRELQAYTQMLHRATEAAQAIATHTSLEAALQEVANQACRVIGTHQAVVSLDAGTDTVARSFSGPGDVQVPVAEVLTLPLNDRHGRRIGVLTLSTKQSGEFTQRDEYVALELTQLASVAIDNARLFTQIRELNAGLEVRIAERTAELARQERLFRALAEQAPEIVWNTDATGTRLIFLNRAWYDLVGGTPQDWVGKSGMAAIHPDDRAEVAANWLRAGKTLSTLGGVRRIKAKDGSYHTTSYKAAPVLDEHGAVAFWVGIDADITELKAIEQALRSSNQELEAFSYSVSHDLRAPLGTIDGFTRALALKLESHSDDRVKHYLARIQAGVGKMEQLIEALLALAKVVRAPLNFGPVDLSAMAREIFEGLQMQHPGREVTVRVRDALVAQGDTRLLRVVMENLLGNAWKFTSHSEVALIEVDKLEDGSAFLVRDNGVGFDMAYADKLFGAFQRLHTEAEFPGTGIGLATVRRIVARHQGRIWAQSQLAQGTTFFFALSESAPPAWLAGDNPAARENSS